ncbi:MAG: hypothetical protein SFU53_13960 [Terrimicrobiaceae bacterium]|nr:hypothetical protein [Terrimicrobiaceae bacterium]
MIQPMRIALAVLLTSAVSVLADVRHGEELQRGVNCGLPEGAELEPSAQRVFAQPEEIVGKLLSSVRTTHEQGTVRFIRCKFVNPGFVPMGGADPATPGTEPYTVHRAGSGSVELIDCEVHGGRSVAVVGVDRMTRTYIAGGNDLIRVPAGVSTYIEVLGERLQMASPESHSDVLQIHFGKDRTEETSQVASLTLLRCRFDSRGRLDAEGKSLDLVNAAIQLGSFGPHTGAEGTITDCYFDGGPFTLNGGNPGPAGGAFVLRGNRFGPHFQYGAISPGWRSAHDIDDTNVFADSDLPATTRVKK